MRVQLSEKSKAEFIELITKDSITCWFEGDEFVMPSGQGKTAKGIVLGKLLVWQHRQTEVDELQKQVTDLDNRATKYALDAMATAKLNAELQKRVDATLKVVQSMRNEVKHGHMSDEEVQMLSSFADELEQALKGGEA